MSSEVYTMSLVEASEYISALSALSSVSPGYCMAEGIGTFSVHYFNTQGHEVACYEVPTRTLRIHTNPVMVGDGYKAGLQF